MGNFSTFFVISYAEIQPDQKCNSKKVMEMGFLGGNPPKMTRKYSWLEDWKMNFVFQIGPLLRRPYAFPSVRSFILGVPVFTADNFLQSRLCGSKPVLLDLLLEKGYLLASDVPFRNKKVERHQLRHPIGFQTMSSQIAATGIRKAINFGINGIHFRFCSDCHPRNRKW